jgi:hypothetical protein
MDYTEDDFKFSHEFISISNLNKKFYKIQLKKHDSSSDRISRDMDEWASFLEDALEYSKEHSCWIVNKKEIHDFIELVKNVEEKIYDEKDSSEEDYSESESSDTDDELVQKTLARRLKSQSKQDEIDEDYVSDSELEDVTSVCKRFRYLYSVIRKLTKRVEDLENNRQ